MNDLLSTPVVNVARVALSNVLVGGRRFRPNVGAASGRRFRLIFLTSGILLCLGTTTIGTLGRRAELVVVRE